MADLSKDLIKTFAEILNETGNTESGPVNLYGTMYELGNDKCVKIDGSEYYTPVTTLVDAREGDRVMVTLDNHSAVVIGNYSKPPSARDTEDAKAAIISVEESVEGLTTTVSNQAGEISQVKQTAQGLTTTVNGLDGRVSTVEQTAQGLTTTVNGLDGRVSTVEQTAQGLTTTVNGLDGRVSSAQQTADKIEWLIKSGSSASDMVLTDKLYSLTTEKALIEAKKIELNGSVNINEGLFKVGTNGNLKIGGNTGYKAGTSYEKAQFEVTSSGTMYSVSKDYDNQYVKISDGMIGIYNEDATTTIYGDSVNTTVLLTDEIRSDSKDLYLTDFRKCELALRTNDGNAYFNPTDTGATRLGSSSYKWASIWCSQSALNTSSDRRTKTDISYYSEDDRFEKMFMELKPCTFKKTDSEFGRHHSGLIAQEVEEAMENNGLDFTDFGALLKTPVDSEGEELNFNDKKQMGRFVDYQYGLRYGEFTALNIHMIQKALKRIDELEAKVEELENKLEETK